MIFQSKSFKMAALLFHVVDLHNLLSESIRSHLKIHKFFPGIENKWRDLLAMKSIHIVLLYLTQILICQKKKFHILLSMQDTNIINFDDIVNEDKLVNNTN